MENGNQVRRFRLVRILRQTLGAISIRHCFADGVGAGCRARTGAQTSRFLFDSEQRAWRRQQLPIWPFPSGLASQTAPPPAAVALGQPSAHFTLACPFNKGAGLHSQRLAVRPVSLVTLTTSVHSYSQFGLE